MLSCINYFRQEDVVVVNLGSFNMQSIVDHQSGKENVRSLFAKGTTEEEILEVMRSQSYERYIIELKQIQVIVCQLKYITYIKFLDFPILNVDFYSYS